jgi:hypothetical protein
MAHIFISYSRIDEAFARQLATSLSQLGADVWIDIEDIPVGMKWSRAIQEGLDVSDVLLVVISPESMGSHNVEDEWQYYLDQKKPVIPLLYKPTKLHFQLSRIQYIDFNKHTYDKALRQLHTELGRKGVHLGPLPRRNTSTQPIVRMQPPASAAQGQPARRLPIIWLTLGAVLLIVGVGLGAFLSNPNRASGVADQSTQVLSSSTTPPDAPTQPPAQQQQPTVDPNSQSQSQVNSAGNAAYDDGEIRFSYPANWLVERVNDQGSSVIIAANNQTTLNNWKTGNLGSIESMSIQSGQLAGAILPNAEVLIPGIAGMTPHDAVYSFQAQIQQTYPIAFGDIMENHTDHGDLAYVLGVDSSYASIEIMVIDTHSDHANLILILGVAAADQAEAAMRGIDIIANSLQA